MASISVIKKHEGKENISKVLIEIDESFNLGVIGLIAGRLMERFHRPAIVIAKSEKISKASARSIPGFNIIEYLRKTENLLINCGGHPMAAGFTIETNKIDFFQEEFLKIADSVLNEENLIKKVNADCILQVNLLSPEALKLISRFSPFGVGNPEPLFLMENVEIVSVRAVGRESKHLKLILKKDNHVFEAIGFGLVQKNPDLKAGNKRGIVFTLSSNTFNGKTELQLKIKEIVFLRYN